MNEELALALLDVVSPERLEVITNTSSVLEALGFTSHTFEIQQILGLQDGESDNFLLVSRIEDALTVGVWCTLKQFGVVTHDAPLGLLAPLLEGLGLIEHYVIPVDLYSLALSDESPEEVLSTIIPYVSTLEEDQVFDLLTEVKSTCIDRIRQVLYAKMQAAEQPTGYDVSTPQAKRKLNHLNRLIKLAQDKNATLIVKRLADEGVPIGRAITDLYPLALEHLEETSSTQLMAYELLGLWLYSDADISTPIQTFGDAVNAFTDEPGEVHQLMQFAKPLLEGL